MKRFRLTPVAKIICLLLVICLVGGGVIAASKAGLVQNDIAVKTDAVSSSANSTNTNGKPTATTTADDDTINLSLDEWVGWGSILLAAQGTTTQPGSIFD